jgi:hypothetical protein
MKLSAAFLAAAFAISGSLNPTACGELRFQII